MSELVIIGHVRSPWPEKFGIPRQSGMTRNLESQIELDHELIPAEALRGLEGVSHIWVLSWFHSQPGRVAPGRSAGSLRARSELDLRCAPVHQCTRWRPTVRPPRLGGATRLGVFATRAPHRPNPIGLSLVRLLAVEDRTLRVADLDLLDGTPVLDIKPHLPWAEQPADARCDWAPAQPEPLAVRFAPEAEAVLAASERGPAQRAAIIETLRWDPRPAHQRDELERSFGMAILDLELRFVVDDDGVQVLAISPRA